MPLSFMVTTMSETCVAHAGIYVREFYLLRDIAAAKRLSMFGRLQDFFEDALFERDELGALLEECEQLLDDSSSELDEVRPFLVDLHYVIRYAARVKRPLEVDAD